MLYQDYQLVQREHKFLTIVNFHALYGALPNKIVSTLFLQHYTANNLHIAYA